MGGWAKSKAPPVSFAAATDKLLRLDRTERATESSTTESSTTDLGIPAIRDDQ